MNENLTSYFKEFTGEGQKKKISRLGKKQGYSIIILLNHLDHSLF